jgi:hypothetical protein
VVIFVFKGILNFAIPLDVVLLDRVAQVFLAGSGLEVSLISHVKDDSILCLLIYF